MMKLETVMAWSFSIVGLLIVVLLVSIFIAFVFFSHDVKPFMKFYSYDDFPVYKVKMDRKHAPDRVLFSTPNKDDAMEFYLKMLELSK